MDMTETTCVHEVLEEGLECNVCFHLVPQCDPDDPVARGLYAIQIRSIWESRAPTLAVPGTSLCEQYQSMTLDKLCSAKGYMHSVCYWALVASAEVSKCPMCVMMVDVMRGAKGENFDYSVALENPYRTDRWVRVRAVFRERRSQWNNLEIEIVNRVLCPMRPELLSMVVGSGSLFNDEIREGHN
jgi:hypothetical protein